jgi:hypothetical protein
MLLDVEHVRVRIVRTPAAFAHEYDVHAATGTPLTERALPTPSQSGVSTATPKSHEEHRRSHDRGDHDPEHHDLQDCRDDLCCRDNPPPIGSRR